MAAYNTNPFDSLPIETNQHIASLLEYDQDICHFRLVCHSTHDAVDADNCSFWRRRYLACFEKPLSSPKPHCGSKAIWSNVKYKNAYQRRRGVLKNGARFVTGDTRRERECLEVLRDLIIDSFSGQTENSSEQIYESCNLSHLKRFLTANDLLQIIFRPLPRPRSIMRYTASRRYAASVSSTPPAMPTDLLQTLQVLCAPMLLSFEPHIFHHHYGFPDSQSAVYNTANVLPIFGGCNGLDVNMEFILHNINFWKYHILRKAEGTLCDAFENLDEDERPRWWSSQLKEGPQKLGKHWKGSYAYVETTEIDSMRRGRGDSEQIQDKFAGEVESSTFQDLQLELIDNEEDIVWPAAFEHHLRSITLPVSKAKTRAQKRSATPDAIANFKPQSFHFEGEGQDNLEQFLASGWLNPIPPQQSIPGWQRMTMMKYFEDQNTGAIDTDALWAYEGVVLPGGQIILGRWWAVDTHGIGRRAEDTYSGPFLLWCVDGPKYEEMEEADHQEFDDDDWP